MTCRDFDVGILIVEYLIIRILNAFYSIRIEYTVCKLFGN